MINEFLLNIPKGIYIGDFRLVTFYALCILLGAILALKLSQYYFKKRGYDPEDLENLFFIAFPIGILGARLWYVIAEWETGGFSTNFWSVFAIWEGGLAIQGGVILGIIAGVIYLLKVKRNIPLLTLTDCVVPTILVAQFLGRWGNFFNQEVYGGCVSRWTWLPDFIEERLVYRIDEYGAMNGTLLCPAENQMVLPLFLIEGTLNLMGFFLIVYGLKLIPLIIRKYKPDFSMPDGIKTSCYILWYGVVRAILEPLRNPTYIMDNFASLYMAIAFIVIGVAGIVLSIVFNKKLISLRLASKETVNTNRV